MLRPGPLEALSYPPAAAAGIRLFVKRDDRYAYAPDSPLQGNKVRKLAPWLKNPSSLRGRTVVSFGGAYSNHLAALAAAGRRFDFATRMYVRGEAITNPTLEFLEDCGSELRFVDRAAYRIKHTTNWQRSVGLTEAEVVIPEGGSSVAGLAPVGEVFAETVHQLGAAPDYFCLSAGTGSTAAGVILAAGGSATRIEVYPALKGDWMRKVITDWIGGGTPAEWEIVPGCSFGGYARFPPHWEFSLPPGAIATRVNIGIDGLPPLEPVYTAKLFSGVLDRVSSGSYPVGSTVVLLHTGGIY